MPSCKIVPGKLEHKFDCKYWQRFTRNYKKKKKKALPRNYRTCFNLFFSLMISYICIEYLFIIAADEI